MAFLLAKAGAPFLAFLLAKAGGYRLSVLKSTNGF
jgi:hypothetical protein